MEENKVKRPIYKRVWFWAIIIVIAAVLFAGGSDSDTPAQTSNGGTQETIEYIAVSVDDMMKLLSENALNATETYKDQYVEITGRLGVIDSNGSYISLYPTNDRYAIIGVTCYIESDEQAEIVKALAKDQTVTLRGQVTSVGEVFGYSLDIDSFVQ